MKDYNTRGKWNCVCALLGFLAIAGAMQGTHSSCMASSCCTDINGDMKVGFVDFAILASQWMQAPGIPSADIVPDGIVDVCDLALFSQNWLWEAWQEEDIEGLITHWSFNESSGTIAHDNVGHYDGVVHGGAIWVSGQIGNALSFDGVNDYVEISHKVYSDLWVKSPANPMITGQFGSVWYNGVGDYHFFYSNGTNALHATSTDGLSWTPDTGHNPILTDPEVVMVWKEDSTWYMLYRSGGMICLATANAPEGTWTKDANNPVINPNTWSSPGEWDYANLDPWGIIKIDSTYYLWYNNMGVQPRKSGLATIPAEDLTGGGNPRNWTKDPRNPIFVNNEYCIRSFKYNDYYYALVPFYNISPWRGEIRLYRSSTPTFYPEDREYLGAVVTGIPRQWDGWYFDTPSVLTNDIYRDSFPDDNIYMYYSARPYGGGPWKEGLATGLLADLPSLEPVPESDSDPLCLDGAVSISLWAKQDIKHNGNYIGLVGRQSSYLLTINHNVLKGYISDGAWESTAGTTDLATDTWYHFAMTFDKSSDNGAIRIYVNGVEEGVPCHASDVSKTDNNLKIGSYDWGYGANYFKGSIDDVMIFDRRLSPEEIQQIYEYGLNGASNPCTCPSGE
jgi:hypothetical protein